MKLLWKVTFQHFQASFQFAPFCRGKQTTQPGGGAALSMCVCVCVCVDVCKGCACVIVPSVCVCVCACNKCVRAMSCCDLYGRWQHQLKTRQNKWPAPPGADLASSSFPPPLYSRDGFLSAEKRLFILPGLINICCAARDTSVDGADRLGAVKQIEILQLKHQMYSQKWRTD